MPRPLLPLQGERKIRVEEMIADGCPLLEIARTLHMSPKVLSRWYPEARTPAVQRGELSALARKFNQLPDTLRGPKKAA